VDRLEATSSQPPYLSVAGDLLASIRSGAVAPGDRLPTIKALAETYGVSPGTVQSALGLLRDRGIVVTRQGAGTFVRGDLDVDALAAAPDAGGMAEVLSLLRDIRERLARLEERSR
jgi:DNA-binding GntR family transcriptional regulator